MERRRYKRITVDLEARLFLGRTGYSGIIRNISEEGMFVRTSPIYNPIDLGPGATLQIECRLPAGEELNLNCSVKWSLKIPPENLRSCIGIKIIDPPVEYRGFVNTLL
jgi:hypothetical protein